MSDKVLSATKNGAVFIQPDGPNTQPLYMGCLDLDDIAEPLGDIEIAQCVDPNGNPQTMGTAVGLPGVVSTKVTTYLQKVLDAFDRIVFPFTLFVHERQAGRADSFTNYVRSSALLDARVTNKARAGLVKRNETAWAETGRDIQAPPPVFDLWPLTAERQSVAETQALNDIAVNMDNRESSLVGAALKEGTQGALTAAAGSGVSANVLETANGTSWVAGATDPFAVDIDAGPIVRVVVDAVTQRLIVGRGETVAGQPAAIAWSDDLGATWNVVNVGSTNTQFFARARTLFALDQYAIWGVTSGGFIYKSEDGGLTWATQDAGLATVQNLNCVHFLDRSLGYAAGASNTVLRTLNGGLTWAALTAPAGQAGIAVNVVEAVTEQRVWLGYADGKVFFSEDQGATWTQRTNGLPTTTTGSPSITGLSFVNELQGVLVRNQSSVGTIFQTIDGGYTWQRVTTPTNAGLNTIRYVTPKLAFAVGAAQGGTGVLLRVAAR